MDLEADWPEGPHQAQLDGLDDLAKCPICHDFFNVPLSLGCGHAFCSGCIRSNLEFQERTGQAKCPACREKCDSRDLRHNHALKDLVKGYTETRSLLVAAASQLLVSTPEVRWEASNGRKRPQQEQSGRASKRVAPDTANGSRGHVQGPEASSPPVRRLLRPREGPGKGVRSSQKLDDRTADEAVRVSLSSDTSWSSGAPSKSTGKSLGHANDTAKSKAAASKPSKPPPGYVMCPICTAQIRENLLNDHLDKCLNKADDDPRPKAPVKPLLPVTAPVLPSKAKKGSCKLEVPPKLVFSMLKDRELTSKLRALRLPTDGKRQDLEQRYNKLRVEVQMAQDADEPVTLDEVMRRVMRKEKQAAAAFPGTRINKNASKSAPAIPGASSFEELIAKSRERVASRKSSSQPHEEQQQQCREHASSDADREQDDSQGRAPGSEAAQNRPTLQHGLDQPEHAPSPGDTLAGSLSIEYCNGHTAQQDEAAGGLPGSAQCTVYAREPSDKHASTCCGGVSIQSGFFEPLAWHSSVPDSASE